MLFIHGLGSEKRVFGRFPDLLAARPELTGWDLHAIGYHTSLLPEIQGLRSDPEIPLLGTYLRTLANLAPIDAYGGLALVAHSMGGLVVQQALLDDPELADRVSHVFLFGTPSGGARAARWGRRWTRQVDNLVTGGAYITELRERWDERFGKHRPFDLWVVAADRDVWVDSSSSLGPFPPDTHLVVPGGHLDIVELEGPGSMSEQIVAEGLLGSAAPAGPWNSARVAVERGDFARAIRDLSPHAAELDEEHLVALALALGASGRRDEAIELLQTHAGAHGTDAKGTLAGRLKRSWLDQGRRADGQNALDLYAESLAEAVAAQNHAQAYYHAINVAFMALTFDNDRDAAMAAAEQALEHCELATTRDYSSSATRGEANLYLGDGERALAAYAKAIGQNPSPRSIESTYRQAMRVLEELGRDDLEDELDQVFRAADPISSPAG